MSNCRYPAAIHVSMALWTYASMWHWRRSAHKIRAGYVCWLDALAGHTRPSTCWAALGNSRKPLGRGLRQVGVPYAAELVAEIGAQFRAA
jgi:hypothetical protein